MLEALPAAAAAAFCLFRAGASLTFEWTAGVCHAGACLAYKVKKAKPEDDCSYRGKDNNRVHAMVYVVTRGCHATQDQ